MAQSLLKIMPVDVPVPRDASRVPYTPLVFPRPTPSHPGLTSRTSAMHEDALQSDASPNEGPHGPKATVRYWKNTSAQIGGICAGFGVDSDGRLLTITFNKKLARLLRLDAATLAPIAELDLPPREVGLVDAIFHLDEVFKSTAGAYFTVDAHDRVIIPTLDRTIRIVSQNPSGPVDEYFQTIGELDPGLSKKASINSCMPVWGPPGDPARPNPLGYWFLTQQGEVGIARDAADPQVKSFQLPESERICNSFAQDEAGIYLVSDRALYGFALDGNTIRRRFRLDYVKGKTKPGQPSPGSGTTPTLFGDHHIAFGDGDDPMHVNVATRDGTFVTKRPVFPKGTSACENSFIGVGRTLIVANTYGYRNPLRWKGVNTPAAGVVRLDLDPTTHQLTEVWSRPDVVPASAVPKLSLPLGLVYVYSMRWLEPPPPPGRARAGIGGRWRWSLLGLSIADGRTVYDQPIFEGDAKSFHDNGWGTMTPLGAGALVLGMWSGAMRIAAP